MTERTICYLLTFHLLCNCRCPRHLQNLTQAVTISMKSILKLLFLLSLASIIICLITICRIGVKDVCFGQKSNLANKKSTDDQKSLLRITPPPRNKFGFNLDIETLSKLLLNRFWTKLWLEKEKAVIGILMEPDVCESNSFVISDPSTLLTLQSEFQ